MRIWMAAALAVLLNLPVAHAQAFDAARVVAFCTEAQAFNQKFGGKSVENPGRVLSPFGNRRAFDPRADFPPFSNFEAGFTPKSGLLHSAQASADYATAAEAIAAFDAISAALSEQGRFIVIEKLEREQEASGFIGETKTFLSQPEADPPVGLNIDLRLFGRTKNPSSVQMDCGSLPVIRRGEAEAF